MAEPGCGKCWFRSKYDRNPRSLLGRLWRWHIRWCPGWKRYYRDLPGTEQEELRQRYGLR